jgi:glycolate oxidase
MSLAPRLLADLRRLVGEDGLVTGPVSRAAYECDGYTLERAVPDLVVLPRSPEEAAGVVACLAAHGASLVPRGAGTSLAGGCLASPGAVVVGMSRLRRIEALDPENGHALVEAGVVNLALTRAALPGGLVFAPDPSSQPVSTVGGNIANNSGGPHTLKHGVTASHVLAVELVTPDGTRRWLGSRVPARGGLDLAGLAVGSEGTFGLVTRAWVRLVPPPPAVRTLLASFRTARDAGLAVTRLVASGIVPAAVELMDAPILDALRRAFGLSFPPEAGAALLVELDGFEEEVEAAADAAAHACETAGAFEVRRARGAEEREALWTARKRAFGALGRLARNACTQDGVVPRSRLPEALDRIREAMGISIPCSSTTSAARRR